MNVRKSPPVVAGAREVRGAGSPLQVRSAGSGMVTFTGYASLTEVPYEVADFQETIARGAFAKTLATRPDVQMLVNHTGLPLARTTAGNLTLTEDSIGLRVDAQLDSSDPDVEQLVRKLKSGLLDQMSFAFRVVNQSWSPDYENRRITEVDLSRGDVSVVNYGASPTTWAAVRKLHGDKVARSLFPKGSKRGMDLDTYRAIAWLLKSKGQK